MRGKAGLGCGLVNSCSISPIPPGVNAEAGITKSRGQIRLILILTMQLWTALEGYDLVKVVQGVEGQQADNPHWEHGNVLAQGKFHGAGVPGDECILKERRQRTTAKLDELECRGREKQGAHLCREMLNKEDLCRNSRREYAQ